MENRSFKILAKGSSQEGKWHESTKMFILVLMLQTTAKQDKAAKKHPDLMLSIFETIWERFQDWKIYQTDPCACKHRQVIPDYHFLITKTQPENS